MKNISLLVSLVVFSLLLSEVHAGLMTFEESIALKIGDKKRVPDMGCVWTAVDAVYEVGVSDNLDKFVDFIEIENCTDQCELTAIDCPDEAVARRACMKEQCTANTGSAKMYIVYFSAPDEFNFDMDNGLPYIKFTGSFPWINFYGKEQKHEGGLRVVKRQGAAVGSVVRPMVVYYTPYNGWAYMLAIIIIVAIAVLSVLTTIGVRKKFFPKFVEVMWCSVCQKNYSEKHMFCPTCGRTLERKTIRR